MSLVMTQKYTVKNALAATWQGRIQTQLFLIPKCVFWKLRAFGVGGEAVMSG